MIEFLKARYKDGARGEDGQYDCWGLVRAARVALYGRPMLPAFGGEYQRDPAGFTRHYATQAQHMCEVGGHSPGVVIAVLRGQICIHVALCVEGGRVLEINPRVQARCVSLSRFLDDNAHRTIKYYDDQNLAKPA